MNYKERYDGKRWRSQSGSSKEGRGTAVRRITITSTNTIINHHCRKNIKTNFKARQKANTSPEPTTTIIIVITSTAPPQPTTSTQHLIVNNISRSNTELLPKYANHARQPPRAHAFLGCSIIDWWREGKIRLVSRVYCCMGMVLKFLICIASSFVPII